MADPEVCFWTHRRPASGQQRALVDYAMLRELFGRMLLRPDDVYRRLSYLVALVLIRKRFLRLLGFQRRAGREVMVVTRGAGQPSVDVPAPLLTPEDLGLVRDQLAQLLNTDLADHELPELAALHPERGETGTGAANTETAADGGISASSHVPPESTKDPARVPSQAPEAGPDPAAVSTAAARPVSGVRAVAGTRRTAGKRSRGQNSPPA